MITLQLSKEELNLILNLLKAKEQVWDLNKSEYALKDKINIAVNIDLGIKDTTREQQIKQRLDDMDGYELHGQNGTGLNRHTQQELHNIATELLETITRRETT